MFTWVGFWIGFVFAFLLVACCAWFACCYKSQAGMECWYENFLSSRISFWNRKRAAASAPLDAIAASERFHAYSEALRKFREGGVR